MDKLTMEELLEQVEREAERMVIELAEMAAFIKRKEAELNENM